MTTSTSSARTVSFLPTWSLSAIRHDAPQQREYDFTGRFSPMSVLKDAQISLILLLHDAENISRL